MSICKAERLLGQPSHLEGGVFWIVLLVFLIVTNIYDVLIYFSNLHSVVRSLTILEYICNFHLAILVRFEWIYVTIHSIHFYQTCNLHELKSITH